MEKYGCGTTVTDYHEILNDPEVVGAVGMYAKQRPRAHHHGAFACGQEHPLRKAGLLHATRGAGDAR